MFISEIYHSRQGEGLLAGTPSVFVRTSGCNLRCDFCDTPFASWEPTGQNLTIGQIVQNVQQHATSELPSLLPGVRTGFPPSGSSPTRHVVLTGGEPLLPGQCVSLCESLKDAGFHITIETAGTIARQLKCDLISISPKLSNSDPSLERAGHWRDKHQQARCRPDVASQLIHDRDYQFKFVVAAPDDLEEIIVYLGQVENVDHGRVMLMPEGIDQAALKQRELWLKPICYRHGFQLCQRHHIFWYGNCRST